MKNFKWLFLIALISVTLDTKGQEITPSPIHYDILSAGLGMGLDFGGFGGNFMICPQKNIGIFGGVGYALAGLGYNVGIKLRLLSLKKFMRFSPSILAMDGYNTAIYITNATAFNKIFYGPTFGLGLDFRPGMERNGYLCMALLIPIRGQAVYDYVDYLKNDLGATFNAPLVPFAISFGYRFILH